MYGRIRRVKGQGGNNTEKCYAGLHRFNVAAKEAKHVRITIILDGAEAAIIELASQYQILIDRYGLAEVPRFRFQE
jgi:hypothetical protein